MAEFDMLASAVADAAPIALLRCSADGTIQWANTAAVRLLDVGVGANLVSVAPDGHDSELLIAFLTTLDGSSSRQVQLSLGCGPVELLGRADRDRSAAVAIYDLSAFRAELEAERRAARVDALTGLANRTGLFDELRDRLAQGEAFTFGYADVDRFKIVNDTYGHRAGDVALRHIARTLERLVGHDGMVSRFGGDEFGILLPGVVTEDRQAAFCAELSKALDAGAVIDGTDLVPLSASIGFATTDRGESLDQLLGRADVALYRAKSEGRPGEAPTAPLRSGQSIEQLRERADIDTRTGLFRDHVFEADLPLALDGARNGKRALSVVLVDLDRFHDFNARYLYERGHAALRAVASAMKAAVRDGDRCYRYGGEEFAVILPDADEAAAMEVAERIRSAVEALSIQHEGTHGGKLTVSAGVCTGGINADPLWLVNGANVGLIEAKTAGRNRTRTAAPVELAPQPIGRD